MRTRNLKPGEAAFAAIFGGVFYGGCLLGFLVILGVMAILGFIGMNIDKNSPILILIFISTIALVSIYGYRNLRRIGNFFG